MDPISTDEQQRIVLFNAAAEAAFRWPRARGHRPAARHVDPRPLPCRASRSTSTQFARTGSRPAAWARHDPRRRCGRRRGIPDRGVDLAAPRSRAQCLHGDPARHHRAGERRAAAWRAAKRACAASSTRRWTRSSPWTRPSTSCCSTPPPKRCSAARAARRIGAPLVLVHPRALSRRARRRTSPRSARPASRSRRMGAIARRHGPAARRRGVPDRRLDLAAAEDGAQVLHRDPARRVRARARRDGAAPVAATSCASSPRAASSAREQEKTRIARELHDELAQALTGAQDGRRMVRSDDLADADAGCSARASTRMERLIDATIAAMRRIAADLRPLVLDDLGPRAGARMAGAKRFSSAGIACELAVDDPDLELRRRARDRGVPHRAGVADQRRQARQREPGRGDRRRRTTTRSMVSVHDNGAGFAADAPRKPQSFGLLGLRERAYLLGGEVRIDERARHGHRDRGAPAARVQRSATHDPHRHRRRPHDRARRAASSCSAAPAASRSSARRATATR